MVRSADERVGPAVNPPSWGSEFPDLVLDHSVESILHLCPAPSFFFLCALACGGVWGATSQHLRGVHPSRLSAPPRFPVSWARTAWLARSRAPPSLICPFYVFISTSHCVEWVRCWKLTLSTSRLSPLHLYDMSVSTSSAEVSEWVSSPRVLTYCLA